jgi:molybdopterin-biosynthesis enzyme MoeA-like protein
VLAALAPAYRRPRVSRLRITCIPKTRILSSTRYQGAPGFWIGNVIVMAGVPSIMQAKLKIGVRMLLETREGDIILRSRSGAIRSSIRGTGVDYAEGAISGSRGCAAAARGPLH